MQPRYLLLDEPTAGLDASGRQAVGRVLSELSKNAGVVVVTHDPDIFLGVADDVLVLGDGRPVFLGNVRGLLDRLSSLSGQGLLESPEIPRMLLYASRHAEIDTRALTLDPARAAQILADAYGRGSGS